MKRIFWLTICLMTVAAGIAQTQQGVVKTRGKMINGQLKPGTGLSGATVSIQGRTNILTRDNGVFSFPVTNKTFQVQGVQKRGYQLLDADATRKTYQYSPNTLYLIMETPGQQAEDKLAAERKIRRTLQRQLQQREDELEELKEQNKLTQEEYHRRLQQLYNDQQNNEKLISEMAQRYAELDYDQLDELNRQISDAILNGELARADSLLRSKGDIRQRAAELRQHEQANEQVRRDLEKSEALARQRRDDLARDCYNRFELCKMNGQFDSATYYITLRAQVDTMHIGYMIDAARHLNFLNYKRDAARYWMKAFYSLFGKSEEEKRKYTYSASDLLNAYTGAAQCVFQLADHETGIKIFEVILDAVIQTRDGFEASTTAWSVYNFSVVRLKKQLASMYLDAKHYDDCERLCNELPTAFRPYYSNDSTGWLSTLASIRSLQGILYKQTKRYRESETMYQEAIAIRRRLAIANPQLYEDMLAVTLTNLANLYSKTHRYDESEATYQEALAISRRLAQQNPQAYLPDVALTQYNIALLKTSQKQYAEALAPYEEALDIYRRLTKVDPTHQQLYEDVMAQLSITYTNVGDHASSSRIYNERLPLLKAKYEAESDKWRQKYAAALGSQAFNIIFLGQFAEAEQLAREALAIDSTQHFIIPNLAAALLFQGQYEQAEQLYRQYKDELKSGFLDDLRRYAEAGIIRKEYEADVEKIKRMLNE